MTEYTIDRTTKLTEKQAKVIGGTFSSAHCGDFKVLGYYGKNSHNHVLYVIEFIKTGYQTLARSDGFRTKTLKDPYAPTVRGIGFNGDYEGFVRSSPFYQTWMGILDRACDTDHKAIHPTYIHCTISDDWLNFSIFDKEAKELIGYTTMMSHPEFNFEIDKDMLYHGNKEYCKEKCMWIPQKLNSFFTNINIRNTTGYEGISPSKYGTYYACISINGETNYLGSFITPQEAYEVYHAKKLEVLAMYLNDEFAFLDNIIKEAMYRKLKAQKEDTIKKN